jgi:DNA-binding transcriptional regulator YiaG/mRNA-degrading endonuclease RelE of RelBE toxin-antitoxin system
MHAVCETHAFSRAAAEAGMTAEEVARLILFLSENPDAGELIVGTGGARKLRFAPTGRGKRGGYRVVTYYCAEDIPVFLMDAYAKGDKIDLSARERAELKKELELFAREYRAMVRTQVLELKKGEVMSKAGKRLLGAAQEMRAIARGEAKSAHVHIPPDIDVKAIRRRLELSQEAFASEFSFSIAQIRDWEQGRTRPLEANRAYLLLIDRRPDVIRRTLAEVRADAAKDHDEDELALAI